MNAVYIVAPLSQPLHLERHVKVFRPLCLDDHNPLVGQLYEEIWVFVRDVPIGVDVTGGRPPVIGEKDGAAAIALLRDPNIPVKEVAFPFGIFVTAHYPHFPGGRAAIMA